MIKQAVKNQVKFKFLFFDVWFAGSENLTAIKRDIKRDFSCPLKTNRKVAKTLEDKLKGHWVKIETIEIQQDKVKESYFASVDFALLLINQVFTNEDGSSGILYLVSSALTRSADQMKTIYQRRWKVECYHNSLKQNVSLAKSPTQTETTQTNHFFAALCGYIKLEMLKVKTKKNHFALKTKLYLNALQSAFQTLRELNPILLSA